MTSATPSTTSEPEPELVELACTAPAVSSIESHSATFSWPPLGKVPAGLVPMYAIELQQLEGVDSLPSTNWLSVYKGDALSCKVDELKSGRRYAARLVASVESVLNSEESPDVPGVEARVINADHIVFHTPATVPSAIQPPSLAHRARNALKLKWNVPEDPGGPFELIYVLQVSPAPLNVDDQRAYMGFVEVYRGPERFYKVTKLQPGVRYTSRVQAINSLGEGPFSLCSAYTTQATVPAPPEPPVVHTSSSNTMTLQWSPPPDNGSPIIGYSLERDDGAGGDFSHAYAGSNTSHTVKGLKPGTQYRFRLRADNDEGRSMWSSTVVLSTGAAPPDSPVSLQVVTAGRMSATLAWRAPDEDGGSKVAAFEVELQAKSRAATACMGSDWLKIFDGEAHACTINSLCPGCAYRVRVRARNSAGWGQWALPVDLTTAADVPEVPHSLQPATCSPTTIVITWAPPRHDGGSKVHMYRMEMASADCLCGRCPQAMLAPPPPPPPPLMMPHGPPRMPYPAPPPPPLSPSQPGSSGSPTSLMRPVLCPAHTPLAVYAGETVGAELRHLQPGCRYIFRVQAVNTQGPSAWTDWVAGATTADVPVTPAPPAVTGVAAGALMLSWQVPPGQGAPVTHYTVEAATLPPVQMIGPPGPAGIIADQRVIGSLCFKLAYRGPHPGCEVRGLEPYCAYAFRLSALNDVGSSPWSVCAAAITSHAQPTCPQSLSAQAASSCKVVLCWAPPERDFGATVVSYTVDLAPAFRHTTGRQAGAGGGGDRSASWTHIYTGPACACSAEGLTPGRTYQFRVRAANMCGCGPYAPTVTATTLPAPPSAAGKPTIISRTATGFRAQWDEPEHTFGAIVTAYVLEVAVAGSDEWSVSYTGVEAAAKVSGLQPATKYLLRVAAVNSAGQGVFGECEAVTTTMLPPLQPTELSVMEVTEPAPAASAAADGAPATPNGPAGAVGSPVSVLWQEPIAAVPHASVLGYEVEARPKPGSDVAGLVAGGVVKMTVAGRRCEARLEGLAPGCLYGIRVRSVGVDGTGHSGWSEEVGVAMPSRPEVDTLSACSSAGAVAVGGVVQRKGGAAGKKAAKRQQAAAAAAASSAAATASAAVSISSDDVPVASTQGGSRGRAKSGGATSRVIAAVTTVAAKKLRKVMPLERLVDDTPRFLGGVVEALAKALFGPSWRRDHARHLRTFGNYVLICCVVVLLMWALYATIASRH